VASSARVAGPLVPVRLLGGAALIGILVAGCVGARPTTLPSDAQQASSEPTIATGTPTDPPSTVEPATEVPASPTAVPETLMPTMPSDLPLIGSAEVSNVLLEIELQRNPMPAGEVSWVKVTLTNVGGRNLTWLHDACASVAGIGGASEVGWAPGVEHPEHLEMFKDYALGGHIRMDPSPFAYATFVPRKLLGKGSYGCADIGITETIHPGDSRTETRWWTGYDGVTGFLPPGGPLTLEVGSGLFWRGAEPENAVDEAIRVEFSVPVWITARDAVDRLSPGEIVDAALADDSFASYVETQKIADGRAEIAWYQPDRDVWEVGVMPWYETVPPRIHGVLVDAVSGQVLGLLDRPWDQATERFP
jgi:hypothetical protein